MNLLGKVIHPPNAIGFTSREVHPQEQYIAVDDNGFLQQSPETSGYDTAEGVYKVATYVWDTNSLSWVRATSSGGGAGATSTTPKSKRFDQASSTTLYVVEAAPGSATFVRTLAGVIEDLKQSSVVAV